MSFKAASKDCMRGIWEGKVLYLIKKIIIAFISLVCFKVNLPSQKWSCLPEEYFLAQVMTCPTGLTSLFWES